MHSCSVVSDSFAIPWIVAHQDHLSKGFSRQEYWSGLPFPPPGELPDPGIEPTSPTSPVLAGKFFISASPGKEGINDPQVVEAEFAGEEALSCLMGAPGSSHRRPPPSSSSSLLPASHLSLGFEMFCSLPEKQLLQQTPFPFGMVQTCSM